MRPRNTVEPLRWITIHDGFPLGVYDDFELDIMFDRHFYTADGKPRKKERAPWKRKKGR